MLLSTENSENIKIICSLFDLKQDGEFFSFFSEQEVHKNFSSPCFCFSSIILFLFVFFVQRKEKMRVGEGIKVFEFSRVLFKRLMHKFWIFQIPFSGFFAFFPSSSSNRFFSETKKMEKNPSAVSIKMCNILRWIKS